MDQQNPRQVLGGADNSRWPSYNRRPTQAIPSDLAQAAAVGTSQINTNPSAISASTSGYSTSLSVPAETSTVSTGLLEATGHSSGAVVTVSTSTLDTTTTPNATGPLLNLHQDATSGTAPSPAPSPSHQRLSTAVIVGVVIGAIIGLITLVLMCYLCLTWNRPKKRKGHEALDKVQDELRASVKPRRSGSQAGLGLRPFRLSSTGHGQGHGHQRSGSTSGSGSGLLLRDSIANSSIAGPTGPAESSAAATPTAPVLKFSERAAKPQSKMKRTGSLIVRASSLLTRRGGVSQRAPSLTLDLESVRAIDISPCASPEQPRGILPSLANLPTMKNTKDKPTDSLAFSATASTAALTLVGAGGNDTPDRLDKLDKPADLEKLDHNVGDLSPLSTPGHLGTLDGHDRVDDPEVDMDVSMPMAPWSRTVSSCPVQGSINNSLKHTSVASLSSEKTGATDEPMRPTSQAFSSSRVGLTSSTSRPNSRPGSRSRPKIAGVLGMATGNALGAIGLNRSGSRDSSVAPSTPPSRASMVPSKEPFRSPSNASARGSASGHGGGGGENRNSGWSGATKKIPHPLPLQLPLPRPRRPSFKTHRPRDSLPEDPFAAISRPEEYDQASSPLSSNGLGLGTGKFEEADLQTHRYAYSNDHSTGHDYTYGNGYRYDFGHIDRNHQANANTGSTDHYAYPYSSDRTSQASYRQPPYTAQIPPSHWPGSRSTQTSVPAVAHTHSRPRSATIPAQTPPVMRYHPSLPTASYSPPQHDQEFTQHTFSTAQSDDGLHRTNSLYPPSTDGHGHSRSEGHDPTLVSRYRRTHEATGSR